MLPIEQLTGRLGFVRLSVAQAAIRLRISPRATRRLIVRGPLCGIQSGHQLFVEGRALARYVAEHGYPKPLRAVGLRRRTASGAIVRLAAPALPPGGLSDAEVAELMNSFLSGRNPNTMRAYQNDLEQFRRFLGAHDITAAGRELLASGPGKANLLALRWRNEMVERRAVSPTSLNRRLAALRSLVKMGRMLGVVSWTLEVKDCKVKAYRDTRGPGRAGVELMMEQNARRKDAIGFRDRAMLRLLYDRALRASEVLNLDRSDVDLEHRRINVLGKARTQKEWLTLAEPTVEAIRQWLDCRGGQEGPVFVRIRKPRGAPCQIQPARLSRQGLFRMVKRLGKSVGITTRPHGLRHAAITEALDQGNNIRAVQRFSRHANLATLAIYDDNREDLGGQVSMSISRPNLTPPSKPRQRKA